MVLEDDSTKFIFSSIYESSPKWTVEILKEDGLEKIPFFNSDRLQIERFWEIHGVSQHWSITGMKDDGL